MALSFMIRKYQPDDREQCRALWRELTEWHREIYEDTTIGGEHPDKCQLTFYWRAAKMIAAGWI